jgi:hypothetical protein
VGRYAKIVPATGEVIDVSDHVIQLLDDERGVFEVVAIDLEPLDGLRPGDYVEVRDMTIATRLPHPTPYIPTTTAVPAATDEEATSDAEDDGDESGGTAA